MQLLPQSTKILFLQLMPKTMGLTILISLRDYQEQAIEKISDSFEQGINRQLVTLPTGSGKTVIMAALAKNLVKRTLLLARREELITQAEAKFNGSIAVSTNLSFEKWLQIFGTPELTAALIDRFSHRCRIFTFEGKSARLCEAQRRKKYE